MRFAHLCAATLAGSVVALVACGGSVESSCGNYLDSLVTWENQCGNVATVDSSAKTNFEKLCDVIAVTNGAKDFQSQVDQCASKLKSLDCNGSLNCMITGSLPDGAACGVSTQCAGGRCDNTNTAPSSTSEVTCGKCASFLQVGADCSNGGTCDPSTGDCMQNKCVAFAQQGQSCASAPCASGMQCDTTSKTCQPYPTKGQACTFECASPYACVSGTCADAVQQGGACPTGLECASNLTCDQTTHTCTPIPQVGVGQPCGFVNNEIVDCQTGLRCQDNGTGTSACIQPKAAGEACTVGQTECQTFLACINGTCQTPDYSVCK